MNRTWAGEDFIYAQICLSVVNIHTVSRGVSQSMGQEIKVNITRFLANKQPKMFAVCGELERKLKSASFYQREDEAD